MTDDRDLLRMFWGGAADRIGKLTDLWLSLEEDPESTAGSQLKRILHTMKGEAHMLGLGACASLVKAMEDAVIFAADGVPDGLGDAFLTALDAIAIMASTEGVVPEGFNEILAELGAFTDTAGEEGTAAETPAAGAAPTRGAADEDELVSVAESGTKLLDPLELTPLVHEVARLHLEQALHRPKLREIRRMLRALLAEMDPSLGADRLMERIVKTLSYGSELERRITELSAEWSYSEFALGMALEQIAETVRASAMVNVGSLQAQIHRTARAAAKSVDKKVRVTVTGDAHVDASVERALGSALLHLVRNAVDHGIEMPADRLAAGKSESGHVDVTIYQSDASVRVVIKDDGGGVDLEALRKRIRQVDPRNVPELESELLQRIFDHGVSTREVTTDISGRGVGLDVVAREARAMGGSVRVESSSVTGTRFELVLPTMLRADVVVPVDIGSVRLAVPARAVIGVQRIDKVVAGADGWSLLLGDAGQGDLVPVFDLASLFGTCRDPEPGDPVVVLANRTGTYAVRIDGYHNPRTLSFERMDELPIDSDVVVGVAPAADGSVFFLLDADILYEVLRGQGRSTGGPKASRSKGPAHVLVVEDAPVARELLLGLLRSFGLRVSDAADGRQGLAAARRDRPDLILTDIEMPFLGGLEMIAELRADPDLASIPVIVLTTRGDEELRSATRSLGVRAFLSKQRFVENELRGVIDRCLTEAPS